MCGVRCETCMKLLCVRETGVTIYEWFQNHLSSINHNKDEPIRRHFNQQDHKIGHLKIAGIEKIKHNDTVLRKVREIFWIKKMKTLAP